MRQKLDELGLIENDPCVIGYALFHVQKRSFLSDDYNFQSDVPKYTGSVEDAYIVENKFMGMMDREQLPEPDKFDIAIIPVINTMFGLSVKPGALDEIKKLT